MIQIINEHLYTSEKDESSRTNYYKVSINNEDIWLCDADFKNHPELLIITKETKDLKQTSLEEDGNPPEVLEGIEVDFIHLKDPVEKWYRRVKKKYENEEYIFLQPKKQDKSNENMAKEQEEEIDVQTVILNKPIKEIEAKQLKNKPTIDTELKQSKTSKSTKNKHDSNLTKNDSKIDFISKLLDYSLKTKVNLTTRERLIDIIAKDISLGLTKEEVEEIVEKKMGKILEENKKKTSIKKKKHDPEKVVNWLKLFTTNTHIKYSTHIWDENKYETYESFISGLNSDFKDYNFNDLQYYNDNLYWEKIYPFLFQKDLTKIQKEGKKSFGWGQYKIKIGWQYPDTLKDWSELYFDNKGSQSKKPMEMELSDNILPSNNIKGKKAKYFEDIVNIFKEEIEFRDNSLYIEVKILIKQELPNYEITGIETLKGRTFYTNTQNVIDAIRKIFKMIKDRSESNNIKINAIKKDKELIIEILHINSFSYKEIDHPKLQLEGGSGNLAPLRNKLISLCDFAIESKFRDTKGEINDFRIEYLYKGVDENNWSPRIKIINTEKAEGFKFILSFKL